MEWYTHVSSKRVLTKHEPCHVEKHIESSKKESKHEEAGVVWWKCDGYEQNHLPCQSSDKHGVTTKSGITGESLLWLGIKVFTGVPLCCAEILTGNPKVHI